MRTISGAAGLASAAPTPSTVTTSRSPAGPSLVVMSAEQMGALLDRLDRLELALAEAKGKDGDQLRDREGAAQYLRVSLAKLDALCRREADPIPFRLVGDTRRFDVGELRAWFGRQASQ